MSNLNDNVETPIVHMQWSNLPTVVTDPNFPQYKQQIDWTLDHNWCPRREKRHPSFQPLTSNVYPLLWNNSGNALTPSKVNQHIH